MPYTVVQSVAQLPPYEDMDLTKGRTYRYYGTTNLTKTAAPLWLFGDGLSLRAEPPTMPLMPADVFARAVNCVAGNGLVFWPGAGTQTSATRRSS